MAKQLVPYLWNYYNVLPLMTGAFHERSVMARVTNNLIEGFNKMPRFIIVILDKELLRAIHHFKFGISKMISIDLGWVIKEISKTINIKKT